MRPRSESGITLIEVLIAVSLLGLLSVGVLFAMRIGFNTMEKTDAHLVRNRRVTNSRRIIENELAGFMATRAIWHQHEIDEHYFPFFQAEQQSMRFVTSYSLEDGWRGRAQVVALQVIPGERNEGVRLILNEIPYTGPIQTALFITGFNKDPVTGYEGPRFAPVAAGAGSFVLADRLAFCRISYLELRSEPPWRAWRPDWTNPVLLPLGVRIEMAPLDNTPAEVHVTTMTAPFAIDRQWGTDTSDAY
jgi:hypothetical protein